MHPLLRLALAFCPRDYREHFGSELARDLDRSRARALPLLRSCLNVFLVGVTLHAENLARDVAFALRSFAKAPLFSSVVVVTLAVAIGVNLSVASMVCNILLRPLPYPQSDRLGLVFEDMGFGGGATRLDYPDALDVIARSVTLEGVSVSRVHTVILTRAGTPRPLDGRQIDSAYFTLLGVKPELGRTFRRTDMGLPRAIISDRLWRSQFNGAPGVLGRSLRLDGVDYSVVGIAPSVNGFDERGIEPTDVWTTIPIRSSNAIAPGGFNYTVIARLKPGVSFASADADISRVLRQSIRRRPSTHSLVRRTGISPVLPRLVGSVGTMLWLLYAAVAILMLVGCANVASLFLVRSSTRQRELHVRAALGANKRRIIAQITTEAAMLGMAGWALGLVLAKLMLCAFGIMGAHELPRWNEVGLDGWTMAYSVGLIALIAVLTGTVPALTQRYDVAEGLRGAGRADERRSANRVRALLVTSEVALAMALTIGAGLVFRSFLALVHVDTGFDARNTYVVETGTFPSRTQLDDAARLTAIDNAARLMARQPGVQLCAVVSNSPFSHYSDTTSFSLPGRKPVTYSLPIASVSPEYFHLLRIPLRRGRYFTSHDTRTAAPVAIVSQSFAHEFFGTSDPVGRRIVPGEGASVARTIAGVVGDTRNSYSELREARVYLPVAQAPLISGFLLRMRDGTRPSAGAIDAAFARLDPDLVPPRVYAYGDLLAEDTLQMRSLAEVFGFFAAIAIVLVLSGVYAVSAYAVAQRRHELGIRMAVGANATRIVGIVLRSAALQAALGIASGIVVAAVLLRPMSALLFRTSTLDPLTFIAVTALLIAFTVTAALVPAVRAARADPIDSLRFE